MQRFFFIFFFHQQQQREELITRGQTKRGRSKIDSLVIVLRKVSVFDDAATASLFLVSKPASSAADGAAKSTKPSNGTSRSRAEDAGIPPALGVLVAATTRSEDSTEDVVGPVEEVATETVALVQTATQRTVHATVVLRVRVSLDRSASDTAEEDGDCSCISKVGLETFVVLLGGSWSRRDAHSLLFFAGGCDWRSPSCCCRGLWSCNGSTVRRHVRS